MLTGTLSMQGIIQRAGRGAVALVPVRQPVHVRRLLRLLRRRRWPRATARPFDLPEAESELVAGFATEYSGMRYLLFFMAEWGNLYVIGAIVDDALPRRLADPVGARRSIPCCATRSSSWSFFLKSYAFVFLAIWLRWTLPRIRVDQMMAMCWKYLVPIAIVNFLGTATWMVVVPGRRAGDALGAVRAGRRRGRRRFVRRVRFHIRHAGLERAAPELQPALDGALAGVIAMGLGTYLRNIKDAVGDDRRRHGGDGVAHGPQAVHGRVSRPAARRRARAGHAAVPLPRHPRGRPRDLHRRASRASAPVRSTASSSTPRRTRPPAALVMTRFDIDMAQVHVLRPLQRAVSDRRRSTTRPSSRARTTRSRAWCGAS